MMGPMHIAETEEQALENCRYGLEWVFDYLSHIIPTPPLEATSYEELVQQLNETGSGVVGTPEMAIAQIQRLVDESGGFGCYLFLGADLADWNATLRSYELFAQYVMPHFQGQLAAGAGVVRLGHGRGRHVRDRDDQRPDEVDRRVPSRARGPRHHLTLSSRRTGSSRPRRATRSPRTSISTVSPISTVGGTKPSAMPHCEHRREVAARHDSRDLTADEDRLLGARRTTPFDAQPAEAPCDAPLLLRGERFATSKRRLAPRDDPAQAGLERSDARAELVPVQRQPGLESKRVASAEPRGHDARLEDRAPQLGCCRRPGPRTRRRPRRCSPCRRQSCRCHAMTTVATSNRGTAAASGLTVGEALARSRPLHRDHGPRVGDVGAADGAAHAVGVRSVRHDVERVVAHPPHDDVVEHRSRRRRAGACTGPARRRSCRGRSSASPAAGRERRRPATRTVPRWLTSNATASVRHAMCSASVPDGYASGIVPAAEVDELGTELAMLSVERRVTRLAHEPGRAGVSSMPNRWTSAA